MTSLPDATSCPCCGALLPPEERQAPPLCEACLAKIEREARPVLYTCRISRNEALDIVQTWWEDPLIASDLLTKAQVMECRLNDLPFWRLAAHIAGHVMGYRIESSDSSDHKVPMVVVLNNNFVWTGTASDTGGLGIFYLRNLIGKTISSDSSPQQAVTISLAEGIVEGMRALEYGMLKYSGVPHITAQEVRLRHLESGLIVYPFWIVRYTYAGRNYFAAVDGVTGDLVSGRAPGNVLRRIFALVVAMAATFLATVIGIFFLELIFHPEYLGPWGVVILFLFFFLLVFVIVKCLILVRDALARFRYGAEITCGEVDGGYRSPSEEAYPRVSEIAYISIGTGFCFMVISGSGFYRYGMWGAPLVMGIPALVAYIVPFIFMYNPDAGTASRQWVHEDYH